MHTTLHFKSIINYIKSQELTIQSFKGKICIWSLTFRICVNLVPTFICVSLVLRFLLLWQNNLSIYKWWMENDYVTNYENKKSLSLSFPLFSWQQSGPTMKTKFLRGKKEPILIIKCLKFYKWLKIFINYVFEVCQSQSLLHRIVNILLYL